MIIDTHTHLYLPEFDADGNGAAAVERAMQAGVDKMIFPNVDLSTIGPMKALAAKFPGVTHMAMGLHPTEINEAWRENVDTILAEASAGTEYVAIGEIGIDLYWDKTYATQQMMAFERQVDYAAAHDLPVIIHCRDGLDCALEVLQGKSVNGVFHSFGGSTDDVERIRRTGDFYFGINGVVTFKNCHVRDSIPGIGLDRILVETDSPYLAPVPYRGKRNESAYIINVVSHIAAHLGVDFSKVADVTAANALALFPTLAL